MTHTLETLRDQIDKLDESIVELIAKRLDIVKRVGKIKREQQQNIFDKSRWQDVLTKVRQKSSTLGLDVSFISDVFEKIHKKSQEIQQHI